VDPAQRPFDVYVAFPVLDGMLFNSSSRRGLLLDPDLINSFSAIFPPVALRRINFLQGQRHWITSDGEACFGVRVHPGLSRPSPRGPCLPPKGVKTEAPPCLYSPSESRMNFVLPLGSAYLPASRVGFCSKRPKLQGWEHSPAIVLQNVWPETFLPGGNLAEVPSAIVPQSPELRPMSIFTFGWSKTPPFFTTGYRLYACDSCVRCRFYIFEVRLRSESGNNPLFLPSPPAAAPEYTPRHSQWGNTMYGKDVEGIVDMAVGGQESRSGQPPSRRRVGGGESKAGRST